MGLPIADDLLAVGFETALEPHPVLDRHARDRDWGHDTPEQWEYGTLDGPHEHSVVHSALVLAQNRNGELNRRIWAAQAAAPMPLLEEWRVEHLHVHHDEIHLPFETDHHGRIESLEKMELGVLTHCFSINGGRSNSLVGPVGRAWSAFATSSPTSSRSTSGRPSIRRCSNRYWLTAAGPAIAGCPIPLPTLHSGDRGVVADQQVADLHDVSRQVRGGRGAGWRQAPPESLPDEHDQPSATDRSGRRLLDHPRCARVRGGALGPEGGQQRPSGYS